ncbi:alpha-galactosidase D protein [Rutstroemia sp. NJR-2017a WRK4]|nr:alpha-galactosidase D protein [Rutstroemia sp. NJR-2017a WRK4]
MFSLHSPEQLLLLCTLLSSVAALPSMLSPRINNGLAITPPMGWNSYNHYSCAPNETIVHSNAQALKDLGLADLGYNYITVDCGWTLPNRTANGTLTWNPARFPSGGGATLGNFVHGLGLKFGVYSDAGTQMCMTGDPVQAGSLYDNCYSDAATGYPNVNYEPSTSPSSRYQTMASALATVGRPMLYQICDWGVDFPSAWAPALSNSWRITNDIIPQYKTVARILNQAVPQTSFAGPGHWLDLDMLEVGNNVMTTAEETTHFTMWAILKSPLVIGAALKDAYTSISSASLAILKNKDVISYNQDSLGVAASFKRRWTTDGYEVWAGPLSGDRTVVAVINLNNAARTLTLDLPDVGFQKAGTVKNVWAGTSAKNVLTSYSASVAAHGTLLLELGSTTVAGQYVASDATISGSKITFPKIYGQTTSSNYTLTLHFSKSSNTPTTLTLNSKSYNLPASSTSLTIPSLSLLASANNSLSITSSSKTLLPDSITITPPLSTYYPATNMLVSGIATHTTCSTGGCLPSGSKIGNISPSGLATLNITSPISSPSSSSQKFLTLHYTNNDLAFSTSWTTGTNTRNMSISVNGVVTRAEMPVTGRSSELFGTKGWEDAGVFGVLTAGWKEGGNVVTFGGVAGGVVEWAGDLVGVGVFW